MRYLDPPHPCSYLPAETARLENDLLVRLEPAEYAERLEAGWRRFGHTIFRPRCPACNACRPIRIDAAGFRPDRSQRRVRKANEGEVVATIGRPAVTREKLDLYDRYHARQEVAKGWPSHEGAGVESYVGSFVQNPFPTQEWCYRLDGRLVGVGYVDDLPGKLSAIYFYYDPDLPGRSLGTWNILSVIEHAAARGVPHVHLGYFVAGSRSMAYKARFSPSQTLEADGRWHDFRPSGGREAPEAGSK